MKQDVCPHEETVRRAAGAPLDAATSSHVESCESCREVLEVADFLRRGARAQPRPRLPTAAQVWWRAEIVRRLAAADDIPRAARPILWTLGAGGVAVLLALVFSAAFILRHLQVSYAALPIEIAPLWLGLGAATLVVPLGVVAALFFIVWQDA